MQQLGQSLFGSFGLDVTNESLRRGEEEIRLRPKAFAVLRQLVEHSGQLVTKDLLFQTIWPKVSVNEAVLSQYISEIRKALRDKTKNPRFIETVHRRGYRFIAPVTTTRKQGSIQSSAGAEVSMRPMIRQAAASIGPLPLIGRETELSFLQETLKAILHGNGSLTFISGPAGIGKTRLARELRDCGHQIGCQWLEGKYDKTGNYPYQTWIELVKGFLQRDDAASLQDLAGPYAERLANLVAGATQQIGDVRDAARLDPKVERIQLFDALTHFFVAISHAVPLVLFLDDLQWAPSLDLIHHLARNIGNQRILILGAYRKHELKENRNLWHTVLDMNRERLFQALPLDPLDQREVEQLMAARLKTAVATQFAELVYRKSAGNPFFVEEILCLLQQRKAMVDTERGWEILEGTQLETPESIKVVVNERLERVGKEAIDLIHIASVIGRDFSLRVLRELTKQEEDMLIDILDRCEEAGLLRSEQVRGEEVYVFTHDLTQEALYESIGPARRRRYHLQIGQALERLYTSHLEERYEALAHHFIEGNDLEKAVAYCRYAGAKAAVRSAFGQAVAYFERALRALANLSESRETLEQAIAIRVDLGPVLMATKGFGATEVESSYNSARDLCERFGETPQLFPVLWGLWLMKNFRGEQQIARELGERLLALAERSQDTSLLLQAHHALWTTLFTTGELATARVHCQRGLAIYEPRQHRSHAFLYGGHDPGMCCHGHAARTLWMLGYPDQALKHAQDGISLAQELSHPFSMALALNYASEVHYQRGQWEEVAQCVKQAAQLAADLGFPLVLAFGESLLGRLLIEQGRGEEGIAQINRALAGVRDTGGYRMALLLSVFAEACCRLGHSEQGLHALASALPMCKKYTYESEVLRLKGDLLLQSDAQSPQVRVQEAEACFREAVKIARRQEAKSLELRAATSLSRLWQRQGKQKAARQQLAGIYGWFTEGFDTADLTEAKALLNDLS